MNLETIIQMDKQYYMNTFGDRIPVVFERGQQATLYDTMGNAYTDFLAGIAVNVLGYCHPALTQAICEQARKLLHCSSLFYIESQVKLAKMLTESSCGDKVFFCNSGAEANEGAIKLARKYFAKQGLNKYEILSANNSFHGRTLATLAATGQEKYQMPYRPLPPGFRNVPYNDLQAVKEAISPQTCGVLVEVIQGEGGVVEASPEYITGLRQLCDEEGILLIIDEVQTGIGRTGKLFGYQHFDIEPDIFTLAKGLGGGIPIGAIVAKKNVADAFEPGDHGSTFGGNPLACTAGLAVLTALFEENLIEACAEKGLYFKEQLLKLKDKYPFIKDVRGKGLMLGVELSEDVPGKEIVKKAFSQGYIINCAGKNTLRFVPPLVITIEEVNGLIQILDQLFEDYI